MWNLIISNTINYIDRNLLKKRGLNFIFIFYFFAISNPQIGKEISIKIIHILKSPENYVFIVQFFTTTLFTDFTKDLHIKT